MVFFYLSYICLGIRTQLYYLQSQWITKKDKKQKKKAVVEFGGLHVHPPTARKVHMQVHVTGSATILAASSVATAAAANCGRKVDHHHHHGNFSHHCMPVIAPNRLFTSVKQVPTAAIPLMGFTDGSVQPLMGITRVLERVAASILAARRSVYISMWCCDFTLPIYRGMTMQDIFHRAVDTNPDLHIYMLLNDGHYNKYPESDTDAHVDTHTDTDRDDVVRNRDRMFHSRPRIQLSMVAMYNHGIALSTYNSMCRAIGHDRVSGMNCLHQKYVLVDDTELFLSGVDVCRSYYSSYPDQPNQDGWYWHDMTICVQNPRTPIVHFLQRNHETRGMASRGKTHTFRATERADIPYPLVNQFSFPATEEECQVRFITRSRQYVYLEHQYVYTSHMSLNGVGRALLARLTRAKMDHERDFRCFIISNWSYEGEPNPIDRFACRVLLSRSVQLLEFRPFVEDLLYCGVLMHRDTNAAIYVHTKCLLVDGCHGTLSSANLCDRSLAPTTSTDMELGMVFDNMPLTVTAIEQTLWRTHLCVPKESSPVSHLDLSTALRNNKQDAFERRPTTMAPVVRRTNHFVDLRHFIPQTYPMWGTVTELVNRALHFF